jgi:hypothetical protein
MSVVVDKKVQRRQAFYMVNNIISDCFERWRVDLREMTSGLTKDPFGTGRGRRWDRDFLGEIGNRDIYHSIFLVILTMIPAAVVAYTSVETKWKVAAQFFGAPMQAVISGFLTSSLIFLGSHLNQVPKPFSVAYKLMLRVMSLYPILGFLLFSRWGAPVMLLIYGFFVIRAVRRTYVIPLQNAFLFYGIIYFIFALIQLQALLAPPPALERAQYFSKALPATTTVAERGNKR